MLGNFNYTSHSFVNSCSMLSHSSLDLWCPSLQSASQSTWGVSQFGPELGLRQGDAMVSCLWYILAFFCWPEVKTSWPDGPQQKKNGFIWDLQRIAIRGLQPWQPAPVSLSKGRRTLQRGEGEGSWEGYSKRVHGFSPTESWPGRKRRLFLSLGSTILTGCEKFPFPLFN